MQSLKNSIFLAFKNDYKLLFLLSLPALALCAFGLYQLNELTWATAPAALAVKLLCEFLFIGLLLSLAQICGLKNKGAVTLAAFLYYLTLTADFVLLWYFKERFGAKYLQTMEGGDYNFLTDWRVISYFVLLAAFCFFAVRKFFTASPRRTAAMRLRWCATGLLLFIFLPPLALLKAPHNFYAQYMLAPSPVYTARALLAKSPKAHIGTPSTEVQKLAESYGIWNAANTGVGKPYKRVILIAAESFSVKYLHRFNPKIPAEASREVDALMARYPSASLEHVTLSTLYGLSVIFTSHPFVKLAYENGYPDSFVRTLQQHGYRTAFLRGANEKYMDENILFHQAGFQEVIGRTYFETDPRYAPFINWWGLMDRKLFAYAAEYLQAHQNEPVFLTLLTVDTHVPLGRTDYAGETYREIDAPFYDTPTLPRAFARLGQDVQHFLQDLQARGLWDEDTLIILTGDHPAYPDTPTPALFSPHPARYDDLPFILLTKTPIQKPLDTDGLISQLDIAPTVLDLLNIQPPKAFFGHSLFADSPRTVFDIKEDYAVITTHRAKRIVPLNSKRAEDKTLLELLRTFPRS